MEMADLPEPFREHLRRIVTTTRDQRSGRSEPIDIKHLAERLGVSERMFRYWMEPGDSRRCPAQVLPALCRILGNYRVLDVLESAVGRVAYEPLDPGLEPKQVSDPADLMIEAGEVIKRFGEACKDGRLEAREAEELIGEVDDVIREAARLKHWLEHRIQSQPGARSSRASRQAP